MDYFIPTLEECAPEGSPKSLPSLVESTVDILDTTKALSSIPFRRDHRLCRDASLSLGRHAALLDPFIFTSSVLDSVAGIDGRTSFEVSLAPSLSPCGDDAKLATCLDGSHQLVSIPIPMEWKAPQVQYLPKTPLDAVETTKEYFPTIQFRDFANTRWHQDDELVMSETPTSQVTMRVHRRQKTQKWLSGMAQWCDGKGGYDVKLAFLRNETSTTHCGLEQARREGDFKVERGDAYDRAIRIRADDGGARDIDPDVMERLSVKNEHVSVQVIENEQMYSRLVAAVELGEAHMKGLEVQLVDSRVKVTMVNTLIMSEASGGDQVEMWLVDNAHSSSDSYTRDPKVMVDSLGSKVGRVENDGQELPRRCEAQADAQARAIIETKGLDEEDKSAREEWLDFEAIELVISPTMWENDEAIVILEKTPMERGVRIAARVHSPDFTTFHQSIRSKHSRLPSSEGCKLGHPYAA